MGKTAHSSQRSGSREIPLRVSLPPADRLFRSHVARCPDRATRADHQTSGRAGRLGQAERLIPRPCTRHRDRQRTHVRAHRRVDDVGRDALAGAREAFDLDGDLTEAFWPSVTALIVKSLDFAAVRRVFRRAQPAAARSTLSDLDYHVIGERPDLSDPPGDIDVVAAGPAGFLRQLANEDDFRNGR